MESHPLVLLAAFARNHNLEVIARCVAPGTYRWQAHRDGRTAEADVQLADERAGDGDPATLGLACLDMIAYTARKALMPLRELLADPDGDDALAAYDTLTDVLTEGMIEELLAMHGDPLTRNPKIPGTLPPLLP